MGELPSDLHGSAAGCIINVPGCRVFGLLLPEYGGPYRISGAAAGIELGSLVTPMFVLGVQLH